MVVQQMLLAMGAEAEFEDATGGTVTTPGDGYKYHLFTTPGTFTVNGGKLTTNQV